VSRGRLRATINGDVNRFVLGGLTGAVLVGLVLVAVLSLAGLQISDEDVKVPSLLGDRASVAKAKVEAAGLKVRMRSDLSSDSFGFFGPSGPVHVLRQVPDGNEKIPSDGTVTLFVG
jgi:beta-lactam-binding protein with PASTA domain